MCLYDIINIEIKENVKRSERGTKMKFEYKYSKGETLYIGGQESRPCTVQRRCGSFTVPCYYVIENGSINCYAESDLSAEVKTEENITEENITEEENLKKRKADLQQAFKDLNKTYESLSKYSRNLNELALKGELAKTYNRQVEVDSIKKILLRRTKPNPLLTGVAGCGKTAIVEELARQFTDEMINNGEINATTPIIYDLSLNALVGGAKYRGDFEERLQKILDICNEDKDIVIFIDEIHSINTIGGSDGSTSAGQILKPALARGQIRCIGATTTEEFEKYIKTDKALTRRFTPVPINQLCGDTQIQCISNILNEYGDYFKIDVSDVHIETLSTIVNEFIPNTTFPDNVVDIIDETLAIAKFDKKEKVSDIEIKQTASRQHNIIII